VSVIALGEFFGGSALETDKSVHCDNRNTIVVDSVLRGEPGLEKPACRHPVTTPISWQG